MASPFDTFAPFDCQGVWWLPGEGERPGTAGRLRFAPESGLTLELIGVLGKPPGFSGGSSKYPVIYGAVKGLELGTFVTLVDSFQVAFSMASPGLSTETIRASEAYIGDHLQAEQPIRFRGAEISTSYLSSWMTDSGITLTGSSDAQSVWDIKYEQQSSHVAHAEGHEISIHVTANVSRSIRSISLTENVAWRVKSSREASPELLNREVVHPLQNLITFATDRANAITRYRFLSEDPESAAGDVLFLYKPVYADRSGDKWLFDHDILFSFADIKTFFDPLVAAWFRLYRELRPVFDVYFSSIYGASSYVERRFLTILETIRLFGEVRYASAQQLLTTEMDRLTALLPNVSAEVKAELRSYVHPQEEQLFRAGLTSLLEDVESRVPLLLGQPNIRLVDEALSIWRQITHRARGNEKLSGAVIHWSTQRLAYLFKAAILLELGFSSQKIDQVFRRNRQIVHLRSLVQT